MNDEFVKDDDQRNSDYDTSDADVPVAIHHSSSVPNAAQSNSKQNRRQHYAERALHCVRVTFVYVWQQIIGNKSFWEFTATIAVAIATSFYTYYARKQWKVANDTLIEIRNSKADTNRIITASEIQAGASQRTASASDKFATSAAGINTQTANAVSNAQIYFRDEERPYIFSNAEGAFSSGKTPPEPPLIILRQRPNGSGFDAGVSVTMRNSGRSPAIEAIVPPTKYIVAPRKTAIERVKKFRPDYREYPTNTIAAGGGLTAPSDPIVMSKEEVAHLGDGTWQFFVVGGVRYRDMFSPRIKPYETTYCYRVNMQGMPFGQCDFGPGNFGASMK